MSLVDTLFTAFVFRIARHRRNFLVLAVTCLTALPGLPASADEEIGPQYFRSFSHWERWNGSESSFEMAGNQLSLQRGENEPSALLTKEDFENFEISFDFLLSKWCESGLYIHAPRNGAFRSGLEIALSSQSGSPDEKFRMGAISGEVAPLAPVKQEANVWHAFSARVEWPRLRVLIDNVVVQDIDLSTSPELRFKLRRGAIGFQNNGYAASFRNFTLTPLPDSTKEIALFNGHDLEGWHVATGEAKWTVEDGAIVARESDGYLMHDRTVQDFSLRMYIRASSLANGGVFFRWVGDSDDDRGYEIQILDVPGTDWPTGSIYSHVRGNDLALSPGQWELLQIIAEGGEVHTLINGVPSASATNLEKVRPGHIVLQMHRTRAQIEFKEILLEARD